MNLEIKFLKNSIYLLIATLLMNCQTKFSENDNTEESLENEYKLEDDTLESQSIGTVGQGQLINGRAIPMKMKNFGYFSRVSFVAERNFTHSKVRRVITESYKALYKVIPDRFFYVMECSNKNGGVMTPHRTHQNGLSVDFMSLLMKNGQIFTKYDHSGLSHYAMEFNERGEYAEDLEVEIDFETMAKHILALDDACKKEGLQIVKIILKVNLQDDLFQTESGKILKSRGLYFTPWLPAYIDNLHDDHYHIDFAIVNL